ncbi:5'-3' exoribonuclease 2 homolog [Onthophagus taurus]|uniref:5'-3' exoribonuclease 2 homolog n=1 Tax=Onthophagus taurus TaxID=166361 RepID=UPI0039BE3CEC
MGVPAFFRWLSRKYPSVVVHCIEQKTTDLHGNPISVDSSEPNPNGVEFDNLYLDMNGIIHPCTHPEDKPAPKTEDEMMIAIFECIDRLFRIVRPRKLLYMAIDGVAPRAKMNQQRSRRFRASKETVEKVNEMSRIRAELLLKGAKLPAEKAKEEHFDSNCITPGTPFMARLSECLHFYIHDRLNKDPGWKGVKVILSDANVPGEGEHKIMDYIRKQRGQPDHDPNTQHCLCGADADLIMLGLATHEPNFTIIREEFKPNKPRPCDLCGQLGHEMKECMGLARLQDGEDEKTFGSEQEFIFVRLNVLREYLERELQMPNLPFTYDFERVIDDWVFMCFFVGNDFLPHLPSLEIREGAIDRLVGLYKDCVYKTHGYLTDSGDVNLERVQLIMFELGKAEDEIFKTRQQKELAFKARDKAKKRRTDEYQQRQRKPDWAILENTQFAPIPLGQSKTILNPRQEAFQIRKAGMHSASDSLQSADNKEALESMLRKDSNTSSPSTEENKGIKRKHDESDEEEEPNDEVRLWEDGFKDRYYESKFDVTVENLEFRNAVALQYVRGLCWVLRYYYQGCASWKWYYPYHYAPFASDFINIAGLSTEFSTDSKPFLPLQQLMGVFPAASSRHIPQPWTHLMSDPDSPIIDFYPTDFKIDLNGKKFAWQGVALLPFVNETRLFKALEPYYSELTPEEVKRNIRGDDRLYVANGNRAHGIIKALYSERIDKDFETAVKIDGMSGTVLLADDYVPIGETINSPIFGLKSIHDNKVCCIRYRDPKYNKEYIFPARKLKGAKTPPRVLKPQGMDDEGHRNWRPQIGMAPSTTRASLGRPGHRALNHYVPRGSSRGGQDSRQNQSYRGGYQSYNQQNSYQQGGYYQNQRDQQKGSGNYYNSNYSQGRSNHGSGGGGYNSYNSQSQQGYSQQRGGYNTNNSGRYQQQGNRDQHRRTGGPYKDRFEPYSSQYRR